MIVVFNYLPFDEAHNAPVGPSLDYMASSGQLSVTGSDAASVSLLAAVKKLTPNLELPYAGQATFDWLREVYNNNVGAGFAFIQLQEVPALDLRQTRKGWAVIRQGGAEHPGFGTLLARLRKAGYEAQAGPRWQELEVVNFSIPPGEEVRHFDVLLPIIARS